MERGINGMKKIMTPWVKLAEYINREDYNQISALQAECINADKITLKLELDYKLAAAMEDNKGTGLKDVNEFMYYDGNLLIGYIGICGFGGQGMPLEITGMVHPDYRHQGVFGKLHELVLAECKRRNSGNVLILCDKKSTSGQRFVEKTGADYKNSEYEMYLQPNYPEPDERLFCGITLRKASNSDAYEVARQNAIYFGADESPSQATDETSIPMDNILLPEEEEKRGITIYLAQKDKQIIGKVNLDTNTEVGGIYGLGVLPEYRRKGYGRAVLLKAVEKLKEGNIKNVMLQVATEDARALNLYQSCGFRETSTMDYYNL
jgi:ribosomal protein S18 acetylase RimI-like enzyme